MPKQNNQGKPEATPQPKIVAGDIWQDAFGAKVLITAVTPNRISFVRDNCAHPCTWSVGRVEREYRFFAAGGLSAVEIEMAEKTTKTPADRVAAIRELVQGKKQESGHE